MFLPSPALADGDWHRIEIKWLGTDISVTIDYGLRNALLPMLANKIQGQYIGKILIGGPDTTAGLLASDVGYFEGCIQVLLRYIIILSFFLKVLIFFPSNKTSQKCEISVIKLEF